MKFNNSLNFKKRMGVKRFYAHVSQHYSNQITPLQKTDKFPYAVDMLLLDMNGIFHDVAQKVFKYGKYKQQTFLQQPVFNKNTTRYRMEMYKKVCEQINFLFYLVKPKQTVVLCVDGAAPLSKQNQQRQRRFKSTNEKSAEEMVNNFDSNCLTPGTKFMDQLTKYIHWWINYVITFDDNWRNVKVIMSNEKVPGEGEQKLMTYVRKCDVTMSCCMYGLDADLMFLTMVTKNKNFYILREELYNPNVDYNVIDIGGLRSAFVHELDFLDGCTDEFSKEELEQHFYRIIVDWVFICFAVGNDFLPHVPGIEILENGLDILIETYKKMGIQHGYLVENVEGEGETNVSPPSISLGALQFFYSAVAEKEKSIFENKLGHNSQYFPDQILEMCSVEDEKTHEWKVDIEKYSAEYYRQNFSDNIYTMSSSEEEEKQGAFSPSPPPEKIVHEYVQGLHWVLRYYLRGVPSWDWRYPYHYAPFAHDICKHIPSFKLQEFNLSIPTIPFVQLMSVLPAASASLLPSPLSEVLSGEIENERLAPYFPKTFHIDLSGKKQQWEGEAIIRMVNYDLITEVFEKYQNEIEDSEKSRNRPGHSYQYGYSTRGTKVESKFGNFIARVEMRINDFCDF